MLSQILMQRPLRHPGMPKTMATPAPTGTHLPINESRQTYIDKILNTINTIKYLANQGPVFKRSGHYFSTIV